ncbi:hypothetical protein GUJ93_ZPchr0006g44498 [Zizania palustris]|uniref:Uncharacterized protein n=1 Tax=Zizania palustris TaxID=103762 RepID=A0A8J5T2U6_ZIZPA|nr:hypothetical protein GUJ93_ZPchr0006g44498 [Zizania palustris]
MWKLIGSPSNILPCFLRMDILALGLSFPHFLIGVICTLGYRPSSVHLGRKSVSAIVSASLVEPHKNELLLAVACYFWPKNESLLAVACYFCPNTFNAFIFCSGPMTPLLDVLALNSLDITSPCNPLSAPRRPIILV